MSAKVIVGALAFIVAGLVAYQLVANAGKPAKPAAPIDATPPADATFLEDGPVAILGAVGASRNKAKKEEIYNAVVGSWVPEPGWDGPVEAITQEDEGETLRIYVHSTSVIGGGYWILAVVGPGHGVSKGQSVNVAGKLSDVRTQTIAGTVSHTLVLKPARVLSKR